jgi:glutaredoxin 3
MAHVEIFTTRLCPYCIRAKSLLKSKGVVYHEVDVTGNGTARQQLATRTGRRTVPQIFINGRSVGGFDDIAELNEDGILDKMLAEPSQP